MRHSDKSQSLSTPINLICHLRWQKRKKAAFTLAEVLITLGIIGIVAAMTLPVLIANYQKKVSAKRLQQTYSQLYQAINMAQVDYGDMKNWEINSNYGSDVDSSNPDLGVDMAKAFAEKYLIKYLKYNGRPDVKVLKNAGYGSYYSKDKRTYLPDTNRTYIVELINGVALFIAYNVGGQTNKYSYPAIFIDINGKSNPNMLGRDFFMFELDSVSTLRLRPAGYSITRDNLLKLCSKNQEGAVYDNLYCTALIVKDGWEIKPDYPW